MTERTDSHSGLSAESLGRAFRNLADEHIEKHSLSSSSAQDEDTFALVERRRSPSLRVVELARFRKVRVLGAAAAIAAGAVLAWGVWGQGSDAGSSAVALSFTVGDEEARALPSEGQVVFSEASPITITFSDESRMELAPHTTLQLHRAANDRGATSEVRDEDRALGEGRASGEDWVQSDRVVLRLAQGEVDVSLAESKESAYSFEAGKYRLQGLGSAFVFAYVPQSETLDVHAKAGAVVVDDPLSGRHQVAPGQKLHLPKGSKQVGSGEPTGASEAAGAREDSGAEPVGSSSANAGTQASSSFAELAKEGRFAEIVQSAERRGIDSVLASASANDLQQLGQAARYVGNQALAERTFSKMVSRFSGSTSARNAQFFLGRLYEQQGRTASALSSYGAYLSQAGAGAYTMDALGRKLLLVKQTQGADSARPIAQDYLRRYPQGPYAKAARELAGGE